MSINLGLSRIQSLVDKLAVPSWKAFHVAGTNGKGSVCAYLDSCLVTSGHKTGRFTSPHLSHERECISLNGQSVDEDLFRHGYDHVRSLDRTLRTGASPFELLTATAFHLFTQKGVEVAVIEVGLGGQQDATNVLQSSQVLASLITKVGLDHQDHLGKSLTDIARAKAGIIKHAKPCVVDGSNDSCVLDTIRQVASHRNASFNESSPAEFPAAILNKNPLLGHHQQHNLALALKGLQVSGIPGISANDLSTGVSKVQWPARLEWTRLNGRRVLVDGAHNPQAAQELARYLDCSVRQSKEPCVFVVAFTQGKNYTQILAPLLRHDDRVVVTKYGSVAGMPWVSCADPVAVAAAARTLCKHVTIHESPLEALESAGDNSIVCGSLYLASELYRTSTKTRV